MNQSAQPAPRPAPPWKARDRFVALLLALLTLVIYLPAGQHGFSVYDDNDYVTQNFMVQKGLTWAGVQWAFTTYFASNWHPLTWLSHMLDCQLFGLDPGAHHLVNALLHALNAALLFALVRRMTAATWAAALTSALFAWHPLRVESVAWVAERKDVLSTSFELLSLICYLRYAGEKCARDFYPALLCFALALLAKPMPVTLPGLLLILDWWPLQRCTAARHWPRLVLEKWPFFLLAAASCVVTFLAQRATAVQSLAQDPLPLRLSNAALAYAQYLTKTLWPLDLAVIYPLPHSLSWPPVLAAVIGLTALSWLAWRLRQTHPYLLAGWLWYLGTLVPVIGLVQVGKQALADRYTYFPLIGIVLAGVLGVKALAARFQVKPLPLALGAGLLLALNIGLTERQLAFWRDDVTLFSHTLDLTTNNVTAQINLGMALEQAGRPAEAIPHYEKAVAIDPDSAQAHNNLANLLDDAGQTQAALEQYQAALRLNPNAPLTHCNLGIVLLQQGRFTDAMEQYLTALRLQPDNPRPHYLMGKALLRHGQSGDAIGEFRAALQRDPNDFQSLTLLAQILATDANPADRDGPAAVTLAEQANALVGGSQPLVLDVLAMAYAATGRFPEAQQTAENALKLAEDAHSPLAATIRQHLLLYQAGQPWHEAFTNALP